MHETKANWLKGNLPLWLVTGLLTIVCGLMMREIGRFDQLERESKATAVRLAVVEEQVREIKHGNAQALAELKAINAHLRIK